MSLPPQLGGVILDFDQTMLVAPKFYEGPYRQALEATVVAGCGAEGRRYLEWHQQLTGHMGILTLPFFNLDYQDFCERLLTCDLSSIEMPDWLDHLDKVHLPKLIYTGSPVAFVERVLRHWEIDPDYFFGIIGWKTGELVPLKFSRSPTVFQAMIDRYHLSASQSWSLGDSWLSDLAPAAVVGLNTIAIGGYEGKPKHRCQSLAEALIFLAAHI